MMPGVERFVRHRTTPYSTTLHSTTPILTIGRRVQRSRRAAQMSDALCLVEQRHDDKLALPSGPVPPGQGARVVHEPLDELRASRALRPKEI